jgi:HK97 family phage major capsid protein
MATAKKKQTRKIANLDKRIERVKKMIREKKAAKKIRAQKKAQRNAPYPKATRSADKTAFFGKIQKALQENRAVKLNGTGTVNVLSTLAFALEDKTDLLSRFSIQSGASSSTVIPVWNTSAGEFATVDENGDFDESAGDLASVNLMPRAFAKSLKVSDETLKLSAVDFESAVQKILSESVRRTLLKAIFEGVEGRFESIYKDATDVEVEKLDPAALQTLALTLLSKTDNGVILMNPLTYAEITDAGTKKDEILLKQIVESKNIEGVEIILSPFVPKAKTLAGELGNYGIGIANELEITPKQKVGSLAHNFDASIYAAGKAINAKDFFVLKIKQ